MNNSADRTQYFSNLAHKWDETVGNDSARQNRLREIFTMITLKPGDRVLDAGCGNGVLIPVIEEHIGLTGEIFALDACQEMIERAQTIHASYANIVYKAAVLEDADALPENYFDTVLCFAVVPHLNDFKKSFSNLHRSLKKDGHLYIFHVADTKSLNEFHKKLNAPVAHDMLPEEAELKELLAEAGFSVTRYIDQPGLNFVEAKS